MIVSKVFVITLVVPVDHFYDHLVTISVTIWWQFVVISQVFLVTPRCHLVTKGVICGAMKASSWPATTGSGRPFQTFLVTFLLVRYFRCDLVTQWVVLVVRWMAPHGPVCHTALAGGRGPGAVGAAQSCRHQMGSTRPSKWDQALAPNGEQGRATLWWRGGTSTSGTSTLELWLSRKLSLFAVWKTPRTDFR